MSLSAQPTHHFEVFGTTLDPSIVAGEQHVFDIVARSIIEFTHVEWAGLIAVKVGPLLQDLQDIFFYQVWVPDLISGKESSVTQKVDLMIGPHLKMPTDNKTP